MRVSKIYLCVDSLWCGSRDYWLNKPGLCARADVSRWERNSFKHLWSESDLKKRGALLRHANRDSCELTAAEITITPCTGLVHMMKWGCSLNRSSRVLEWRTSKYFALLVTSCPLIAVASLCLIWMDRSSVCPHLWPDCLHTQKQMKESCLLHSDLSGLWLFLTFCLMQQLQTSSQTSADKDL